ncbi:MULTISPECIES: DUF423 domain-containing protein [Pseudomonadati]|uniref:DUF423 domain-containing protein n=1 Tax=Shewanella aestuarii TaxID=1028752 RepID=A0ABT0L2A5_9GAMM|nr:DUF423 domain-containing protein [Shewanella aestuarii]MCL1117818.1 DUF423 domain-containing protein [Shewanella aestuarii]GGN77251.1 membrane protein [Shewanella aestuarii]
MKHRLLSVAAMSGFLAVALGAFAAHGLKKVTSTEMINIFNLAVEYQFYHTFALIGLAFAANWLSPKLVNLAAGFFITGIVLFSGSLYLYALIGQKWLGPITPIGGICLLIGWAIFATAAWRKPVNTD